MGYVLCSSGQWSWNVEGCVEYGYQSGFRLAQDAFCLDVELLAFRLVAGGRVQRTADWEIQLPPQIEQY